MIKVSLVFKCPICATLWTVGPNIEKSIRLLRILKETHNVDVPAVGDRKCNGCGRVMTIEEIIAKAYDPK